MKMGTAILRKNVRRRIRILGSRRAVAAEIGVTHSALDSLLAGRRPQTHNRVKYDKWNEEYFGERLRLHKPRIRDLREIDAAIVRIVRTIAARPIDQQNPLYLYAMNEMGDQFKKLSKSQE